MIHDPFDNNDPQTTQIIQKVLRKKLNPNSQTQYHHQRYDSSLVYKVNESLNEQNNQMEKQINRLENKIKKMLIFNQKNKFQEEKSKIEDIRKRINRIQTLNTKLTSRILSESRVQKRIKNSPQDFPLQSRIDQVNNFTKRSKKNTNEANHPRSPILQFSLYTLNQQNESNTTEYLKQEKRKKNIGSMDKINMQKSNKIRVIDTKDKEIQVNIDYMENLQERKELQKQKKILEDTIRRNQLKINLYQSKMQKMIL